MKRDTPVILLRTAAISKMERSIFDIAAVLHPPLVLLFLDG